MEDLQQKPKRGPKFRRKEKTTPNDRTLAERIISQREATQDVGNSPTYDTTGRDGFQLGEENYSESRSDLSPSKSVDITHLSDTGKRSPTPGPTFSESRPGSPTELNGKYTEPTTNTNDSTQSYNKPLEPVYTTSGSPLPSHLNADANEAEELKDSKQKDHQEGSHTGSACSTRSQSVNRNHSNTNNTTATTTNTDNINANNNNDEKGNNDKNSAVHYGSSSQEKHSTNSSNNLLVNQTSDRESQSTVLQQQQQQQQQKGSPTPRSSSPLENTPRHDRSKSRQASETAAEETVTDIVTDFQQESRLDHSRVRRDGDQKADGGGAATDSSFRNSSFQETRSEIFVQNSANQQDSRSKDSIDINGGSSPTRLSDSQLNKSSLNEDFQRAVSSIDSSVEINANANNNESSLQDTERTATPRTNSAKSISSGHLELESGNSQEPIDQSLEASAHSSAEINSKAPSRFSDADLAESPVATQSKSEGTTEEGTPTELNNQKLEDLPVDKTDSQSENSSQSSSPAITDEELPRSKTFVKDASQNQGNTPSENDPISKFVNTNVDTMDSVEIDACMKTLEEMVDQSLQTLVSGDKEEPNVLPINEELKKKILSEDFQKKIDNFLSDI